MARTRAAGCHAISYRSSSGYNPSNSHFSLSQESPMPGRKADPNKEEDLRKKTLVRKASICESSSWNNLRPRESVFEFDV